MRKIFIPGLIIGLTLASLFGWALLACRSEALQEPHQARPEEAARFTAFDWPTALAHHNFVLHSFNGRELPEKEPEGAPRMWPNLSFNQWPEVTGRICNYFRGQAEVTAEGRLKIFAVTTRMMCLDESLNQQESIFHQITSSGTEFDLSLDGRILTLSGDGHLLIFHLKDYVN